MAKYGKVATLPYFAIQLCGRLDILCHTLPYSFNIVYGKVWRSNNFAILCFGCMAKWRSVWQSGRSVWHSCLYSLFLKKSAILVKSSRKQYLQQLWTFSKKLKLGDFASCPMAPCQVQRSIRVYCYLSAFCVIL